MAQSLDAPTCARRHETSDAPARDVLEEYSFDRVPGAEVENRTARRVFDDACHLRIVRRPGLGLGPTGRFPRHDAIVSDVSIHLRARPGDYAETCLVPGDPIRAKYLAETYFDDARQVNEERGMLGYTGTFNGTPVSVQSTGMGCPSAAIVIEELVQLGVKRLLRVGTCGGLQPDLAMGELIIALSAVPADRTAAHYTGGEPHAPTADWELVHGAVHAAKHLGKKPRVGPIATSDTFYDPDDGRHQRWSDRGILAVEMEAAVLFTIAALRKVSAACLLTVSDIVIGDEFVRISDDDLRQAVDEMAELALHTVTG